MGFEDLGVVRAGDPLDPDVVPVHVRLDTDDRAGGALSQKPSRVLKKGRCLLGWDSVRLGPVAGGATTAPAPAGGGALAERCPPPRWGTGVVSSPSGAAATSDFGRRRSAA